MATATAKELAPNGYTFLPACPVERLVPTPDNTRRFTGPDEENPYLVELAGSIRNQGVLEPLLARPMKNIPHDASRLPPSKGEALADSREEGHEETGGLLDVRAGACRLRAAKLAGLKTVPVLVREMDDDEAFEVTISENLHREDLHPIEEAESIRLLEAHGWDQESIADRFGKSRRWVARRRSLVELNEAWRDEALSGIAAGWPASALEAVARVPERIQDEILRDCKDDIVEGQVLTVEDIRAYTRHYVNALEAAPWKLDDLSFQGCPSCEECRKRSDREPLLFDDDDWGAGFGERTVREGARCLDNGCWQSKHSQFLARRLDDVRTKQKADPILVEDYSTPGEFEGEESAHRYQLERCKKSEPGARPCVESNGNVFWARKAVISAGAKRSSGNGQKKTLEEKRARLQKRRDLWVYTAILERIPEEQCPWDQEGPDDEDNERPEYWECLNDISSPDCAMRLAAALGSESPHLHEDVWTVFRDSERADQNVIARELALQACQVMRLRIRQLMQQSAYVEAVAMNEAMSVCDLFGWDYAGLCREAEEAIPEPASWKKQAGDRSPEAGGKKGAKRAKKARKKKQEPDTEA